MKKPNIIEYLGLERATSINLDSSNLSESQLLTIEKVQDFNIDSIYFCTDNLNNSHPAVFLKKTTSFDNDILKVISNIHKKIWNYKKVVFLYVYSDVEIRIYNCAEKPLIISSKNFDYQKELKNLEIKSYNLSDEEKLEELNSLFSFIAIDTGIIWTIEEAELIREKINLQRRVDKYLVESLIRTAKQLQNDGLKIDFIHKIILRSLFLLYLEDRGATNEVFYSKIRKGAKSYFDILDNVKDTYALFKKLEYYFNGNVFTLALEEDETITEKQLQLIKNCFINGNDNTAQMHQMQLFNDRLFNFKIIPIELLSEIYENFLSEINPELKQRTGAYYTPPSLVELMLNEKLPINNKETKYNVKILDPSCGSGIFLVESFKHLVKRYESKHNKKLTDFNKLKRLLTENIYGIEINSQSIKVTAFSLYLALVDELNPKTFWKNKNYRLPYLINDTNDVTLKEQGSNLFCRDAIEVNSEIENIEFDLVVGNPPFGTKELLPSIRNYSNKYGFAKEKVLPFLHKATQFSKNGYIVLIFNTKVLTNTGGTYQKFRKWLFNDCYVEKIYNFSILRNAPKNFGGQLFGSATGPISIVFYKKQKPKKPSNTIMYYAPKTFIKSNVIEGVIIDSIDVKYLPREECQKPDTKIWKVAMWGGMDDFNLIKMIERNFSSLKTVFKNNKSNWEYKTGLNSDSKHLDFTPETIINTKEIDRYYTSKRSHYTNSKTYRNIDKNLFKPPFIITKQAQSNRKITSSYIDNNVYSLSSTYIINGTIDSNSKKALVGLINSKFSRYYLFMIASSWGVERERVSFEELLSIPFLLSNEEYKNKIALLVDEIIEKKRQLFYTDILNAENKIYKLIQTILCLNKNQLNVIKDTLDYSLDLFENKQKSKALLPTLNVKEYAISVSNKLNNFLENQNLFANSTIFNLNRFSPLMMIKISFDNAKKKITNSKENIEYELKQIDKKLWEEKATSIYFRKKLNYKIDNDIYIIRPNQRRFWSQSMALEDASELILEILNDI
jgi:type I restriction-modification system DNA methylase subunit